MRNLSQSKHNQLLKSLFLLDLILQQDTDHASDRLQTDATKQELEKHHQTYQGLLLKLEEVIINYERIYRELKYEHVLKKLKSLKQIKGIEKVDSINLVHTIQLSYGI